MTKRPQSRADAPWIKRQEIPDSQILDVADQYAQAFKLLAEQPLGSGIALPMMNSAAMAVELYLKSLSAELIYVEDDPKCRRPLWCTRHQLSPAGEGGMAC